LPAPLAPLLIAIHGSLLTADQLQPGAVVTVTVALRATREKLACVGATAYVRRGEALLAATG